MSVAIAAASPPGQPAPTRRRHRVLVVVVTSVLLLGAIGIVIAVFVAGGPKAATVGFALAALPVGPLIACYMWLDRYEPEPLRYLLLGLGWGAVVASAGALVFELLAQRGLGTPDELTGAVVAPIVEETLKGSFVLIIVVLRRREMDGPLDGVVYAGMVGIGFAFTENVLYYVAAYLGELDPTHQMPSGAAVAGGVFFFRGIMAPFAHPLFTGATGVGLGLAAVTRRRWLRLVAPIAGFSFAVALHMGWNGSIILVGVQGFLLTYALAMVPIFGLAVAFVVWVRRREGRVLTSSLYEFVRLGWLHPGEVRWIAGLTDRAAARRYARGEGGAPAVQAVKEYQQAATELAFLRYRMTYGVAPHDAQRRQYELWSRMIAWRRYVVWPPLPAPIWTPPPLSAPHA